MEISIGNESLLIGGYTLDELKVIQGKVRKDASKIIADNTKIGLDYVEQVIALLPDLDNDLDAPSEEEVENQKLVDGLSKKAHEALTLVQTVAQISGVTFNIPFSEEYNDDGNAHRIEEYYDYTDSVGKLYSLLEDMECDACAWHSSRC